MSLRALGDGRGVDPRTPGLKSPGGHPGSTYEALPGLRKPGRTRSDQVRKKPSVPSGTKGSPSAVPPCLIDAAGSGGAEGTRTPYLNTASVALSRMSYSPAWTCARRRSARWPGNGGDPATASGGARRAPVHRRGSRASSARIVALHRPATRWGWAYYSRSTPTGRVARPGGGLGASHAERAVRRGGRAKSSSRVVGLSINPLPHPHRQGTRPMRGRGAAGGRSSRLESSARWWPRVGRG